MVPDLVAEASGEGIDTVLSSISYALPENVEHLTLAGIAAVNGTGNDLANVLTGNAANNTLGGGAGNDVYVFNTAFAQDTVIDSDGTVGNQDVVRLGSGIAPAFVAVSRSGLNLMLAQDANTVTLQNWFGSNADKIERVEFTDSPTTVWDVAQLRAMSNLGPTVANPIADQPATEDQLFGFQVPANAFSDADVEIGDALGYSATLAGGDELPSWLTFTAATRTFTGTPLNVNVGPLNVQVTATDSQGAFVSDTFVVTVANTNDAPVATHLTQTRPYLEDTAGVALDDIVVADPDAGDAITATLTLALPAAGTLTAGSGNGETYTTATGVWTVNGTVAQVNAALAAVAFVPALNNDAGTTIVAQIHDAALAGPASGTITLDVTPVNDAPVLASALADQGATVGSVFGYTVPLNSFADVDAGDTLTYSATRADGTGLPGWLTLLPGSRSFSGTPGAGDGGTVSVRVTATDSRERPGLRRFRADGGGGQHYQRHRGQ